MAQIAFDVTAHLPVAPQEAWAALTDWSGHGEWIPATTIELQQGSGGVGTEFVARTGVGPVALVDRMRVVEFEPAALRARIVKLGPVLTGTAGFFVAPDPGGCVVHWHEDVRVPGLPQFLAGPVAAASRASFAHALGRLARRLS